MPGVCLCPEAHLAAATTISGSCVAPLFWQVLNCPVQHVPELSAHISEHSRCRHWPGRLTVYLRCAIAHMGRLSGGPIQLAFRRSPMAGAAPHRIGQPQVLSVRDDNGAVAELHLIAWETAH